LLPCGGFERISSILDEFPNIGGQKAALLKNSVQSTARTAPPKRLPQSPASAAEGGSGVEEFLEARSIWLANETTAVARPSVNP
jgi:hypothetical protein